MIDTTYVSLIEPQTAIFWDILKSILLPVLIGIASGSIAFILTNSHSVSKDRKNQSILGIAIIESLLEEVVSGVGILNQNLIAAKKQDTNLLSNSLMPQKSWNGMNTIPNEVLLRIIGCSANSKYDGFHPKDIRTHCKNYFDHMTSNYLVTMNEVKERFGVGKPKWENPLLELLDFNNGAYVEAAEKVQVMLNKCIELLRSNSKSFFPK